MRCLADQVFQCFPTFSRFSIPFPRHLASHSHVGRSCQLPAAPESQADVAFSLASAKVPEDPKAKPGAADRLLGPWWPLREPFLKIFVLDLVDDGWCLLGNPLLGEPNFWWICLNYKPFFWAPQANPSCCWLSSFPIRLWNARILGWSCWAFRLERAGRGGKGKGHLGHVRIAEPCWFHSLSLGEVSWKLPVKTVNQCFFPWDWGYSSSRISPRQMGSLGISMASWKPGGKNAAAPNPLEDACQLQTVAHPFVSHEHTYYHYLL